jgi:hypothetical protein
MAIGLCGPHRTGKSTLAKVYAEKQGVDFLATRSSAVFERLGLSPKEDYSFRTRLKIQEEILADAIALYSVTGNDWITDRTPIDMLAYTLADVQRANIDDEDAERVKKYMEACIRATNMYFSTLILVQPGIEIVEDPTKAPGNMAYIEHLNALIMGLMVDERVRPAHFYVPRRMISIEERLNCVDTAVNVTVRKAQEMMLKVPVH